MNRNMTFVISFIAGSVFAVGLIIAQMVDPNKVVGFLRVFNNWDPSLGLVMAAAIAVAMPTFFYVKGRINRRQPALNGDAIDLPTSTLITPRLIIGSMIFGIGWGMVGFCPAPAVVTALAGYSEAIIFLIAMLAGMWLHSMTIKD